MAESTMEEVLNVEGELQPCQICGRTFLPLPLTKHMRVCERNATRKRKVFNSLKQRVEGTELAPFHQRTYLKKHSTAPIPEANIQPSKWREKHFELVNTIRVARGLPVEMPLSPKRSTSSLTSSGERCPSCDRQFGPRAFDRHVEWCKEHKARIHRSPADVVLAKERLEARTKYRVPLPNRGKRALIRDKYSPTIGSRSDSVASLKTQSTVSLDRSPSIRKPKSVLNLKKVNEEKVAREAVPKKLEEISVKQQLKEKHVPKELKGIPVIDSSKSPHPTRITKLRQKLNTVEVNSTIEGLTVSSMSVEEAGDQPKRLVTWKDTVCNSTRSSCSNTSTRNILQMNVVKKVVTTNKNVSSGGGHLMNHGDSPENDLSSRGEKKGFFLKPANKNKGNAISLGAQNKGAKSNQSKYAKVINLTLDTTDCSCISSPAGSVRETLQDGLKSVSESRVNCNSEHDDIGKEEEITFQSRSKAIASKGDPQKHKSKCTLGNVLLQESLEKNLTQPLTLPEFCKTSMKFFTEEKPTACHHDSVSEANVLKSTRNHSIKQVQSRNEIINNSANEKPCKTSLDKVSKLSSTFHDPIEIITKRTSESLIDHAVINRSYETTTIIQNSVVDNNLDWRHTDTNKSTDIDHFGSEHNNTVLMTNFGREDVEGSFSKLSHHLDMTTKPLGSPSSAGYNTKTSLLTDNLDKKVNEDGEFEANDTLSMIQINKEERLILSPTEDVNNITTSYLNFDFEANTNTKMYDSGNLRNSDVLHVVQEICKRERHCGNVDTDIRPWMNDTDDTETKEMKNPETLKKISGLHAIPYEENQSSHTRDDSYAHSTNNTIETTRVSKDASISCGEDLLMGSDSAYGSISYFLPHITKTANDGCSEKRKKLENEKYQDISLESYEELEHQLHTLEKEECQAKPIDEINTLVIKSKVIDLKEKNDSKSKIGMEETSKQSTGKEEHETYNHQYHQRLINLSPESQRQKSDRPGGIVKEDSNILHGNHTVFSFTADNFAIGKNKSEVFTDSLNDINSDNHLKDNSSHSQAGKFNFQGKTNFFKTDIPQKMDETLSVLHQPSFDASDVESLNCEKVDSWNEALSVARIELSTRKCTSAIYSHSSKNQFLTYTELDLTKFKKYDDMQCISPIEEQTSEALTSDQILEIAGAAFVMSFRSEDDQSVDSKQTANGSNMEDIPAKRRKLNQVHDNAHFHRELLSASTLSSLDSTVTYVYENNLAENLEKIRSSKREIDKFKTVESDSDRMDDKESCVKVALTIDNVTKANKRHEMNRKKRTEFGGSLMIENQLIELTETCNTNGPDIRNELQKSKLKWAKNSTAEKSMFNSSTCKISPTFLNTVNLHLTEKERSKPEEMPMIPKERKLLAVDPCLLDIPDRLKLPDIMPKQEQHPTKAQRVTTEQCSLPPISKIPVIKEALVKNQQETHSKSNCNEPVVLSTFPEIGLASDKQSDYNPFLTAERQLMELLECDDFKPFFSKSAATPNTQRPHTTTNTNPKPHTASKNNKVVKSAENSRKKLNLKADPTTKRASVIDPPLDFQDKLHLLTDDFELIESLINQNFIDGYDLTNDFNLDNISSKISKNLFLESDANENERFAKERKYSDDLSAIDPRLINENDNLSIPENLKIDDYSSNSSNDNVMPLISNVGKKRDAKFAVKNAVLDKMSRSLDEPDSFAKKQINRNKNAIKGTKQPGDTHKSTASLNSSFGAPRYQSNADKKKNLSALKRSVSLVDPVKPKNMKNRQDVQNYFNQQEKKNSNKLERISPERQMQKSPKIEINNVFPTTPATEELFSVDDEMYEEYKKYEEMYLREKQQKIQNEKKVDELISSGTLTPNEGSDNVPQSIKVSADSAYSSLNRKAPKVRARSTKLAPLERQASPVGSPTSSGSDTSPSFFKHSASQRMSKFCHECGNKYPINTAKFCVECGIKRLVL